LHTYNLTTSYYGRTLGHQEQSANLTDVNNQIGPTHVLTKLNVRIMLQK